MFSRRVYAVFFLGEDAGAKRDEPCRIDQALLA
jgi:hypothetical protein